MSEAASGAASPSTPAQCPHSWRRPQGKHSQLKLQPKAKSQQCITLFVRKQTVKAAQASFAAQAIQEESKHLQAAHSQSGLVRAYVKSRFGFMPDLSVSSFQNMVHLRQASSLHDNSYSSTGLPMPSNMAFHDFTPNQSALHEAKFLLGLGSKLVPVPPQNYWLHLLFLQTSGTGRQLTGFLCQL